MRDKPREKMSFRGVGIMMDLAQKYGDADDAPLRETLHAVLIGYYDATPEEIDDLDYDVALGMLGDIQGVFEADMQNAMELQKKAFAPSASSPTPESLQQNP